MRVGVDAVRYNPCLSPHEAERMPQDADNHGTNRKVQDWDGHCMRHNGQHATLCLRTRNVHVLCKPLEHPGHSLRAQKAVQMQNRTPL